MQVTQHKFATRSDAPRSSAREVRPRVGKLSRKTRTKSFVQRKNVVKVKPEVLADQLMTVANDVEKTRDKDMLMYAMAHYERALASDKTKASEEAFKRCQDLMEKLQDVTADRWVENEDKPGQQNWLVDLAVAESKRQASKNHTARTTKAENLRFARTQVAKKVERISAPYTRMRECVATATTIGGIQTKLMAHEQDLVPYWRQGNLELYTQTNLLKRQQLQYNRDIVQAIRLFWASSDLIKTKNNRITKMDYIRLNMKCQKALMGSDYNLLNALENAEDDWVRDVALVRRKVETGSEITEEASEFKVLREADPHHIANEIKKCRLRNQKNKSTSRSIRVQLESLHHRLSSKTTLSYPAFADSFFELTDLWCETTEAEEYCGFLTNLLAAVATGKTREGGLVDIHWKKHDEIQPVEDTGPRTEKPPWINTAKQLLQKADEFRQRSSLRGRISAAKAKATRSPIQDTKSTSEKESKVEQLDKAESQESKAVRLFAANSDMWDASDDTEEDSSDSIAEDSADVAESPNDRGFVSTDEDTDEHSAADRHLSTDRDKGSTAVQKTEEGKQEFPKAKVATSLRSFKPQQQKPKAKSKPRATKPKRRLSRARIRKAKGAETADAKQSREVEEKALFQAIQAFVDGKKPEELPDDRDIPLQTKVKERQTQEVQTKSQKSKKRKSKVQKSKSTVSKPSDNKYASLNRDLERIAEEPRKQVDVAINKAVFIVPERRRVVRRKVNSKEATPKTGSLVVTIPIESKSNVTLRVEGNTSGTVNVVSDPHAPKSPKPEPLKNSETTRPAIVIAPNEVQIEEDVAMDESGDKAEEVSEKEIDRKRGVEEHRKQSRMVAKKVQQPDVEKLAPIECKVQTETVSNTKPEAQNLPENGSSEGVSKASSITIPTALSSPKADKSHGEKDQENSLTNLEDESEANVVDNLVESPYRDMQPQTNHAMEMLVTAASAAPVRYKHVLKNPNSIRRKPPTSARTRRHPPLHSKPPAKHEMEYYAPFRYAVAPAQTRSDEQRGAANQDADEEKKTHEDKTPPKQKIQGTAVPVKEFAHTFHDETDALDSSNQGCWCYDTAPARKNGAAVLRTVQLEAPMQSEAQMPRRLKLQIKRSRLMSSRGFRKEETERSVLCRRHRPSTANTFRRSKSESSKGYRFTIPRRKEFKSKMLGLKGSVLQENKHKIVGKTSMHSSAKHSKETLTSDLFIGGAVSNKSKMLCYSDAPSIFYPTRYFAGLPRLSNQSHKRKATSSAFLKDIADGEFTESANSTNMSSVDVKIGAHAHTVNDANFYAQEISNGDTDLKDGGSSKSSATRTANKRRGRSKAYARVDNIHMGETDTRTRERVTQRKGSAALAWGWKWGRWKLSHQGKSIASHAPLPRHPVGNRSMSSRSREFSSYGRFDDAEESDQIPRNVEPPHVMEKIPEPNYPPAQTFEYYGITMEQDMLSEAELHINDLI